MHEKESLSPRETRGETSDAMNLRLAAQLETLAGTGIKVESLRKKIGTRALGVNPPSNTGKIEKSA